MSVGRGAARVHRAAAEPSSSFDNGDTTWATSALRWPRPTRRERRRDPWPRPARRLHVAGQLDVSTAGQLADACAHAREDGAGIILLDLADVTFVMDRAGLHVLLSAAEANRDDGRLRILLGAAPAQIVDALKVRDRLPVVEG